MKSLLLLQTYFLTFKIIICLGPFPHVPSEHQVKPRVNASKKYTPTNSWFQNLLLKNGDSPIQTYPYVVKQLGSGLSISYSGEVINQQNLFSEIINDILMVKVKENLNKPVQIDESSVNQDFFELSVKINYGELFDVILVRGSASVVANYYSSTPVFSTSKEIQEVTYPNRRTVRLKLNDQIWFIQSESSINWRESKNDLSATSSYTGWIKISIALTEAAERQFLIYGDLIPLKRGKISYSIDRSTYPGTVTVNLEYNNEGLFYLLPHVYQSNQSGANIINGAKTKSAKGEYLLASGKSYQFKVPIFESSNNSKAFDTKEKRDELLKALRDDASKINITSKDPYFGGKEIARASNLLEIAHLLNDEQSKLKVKDALIKELDDYWFGIKDGKPNLMYEPTWGGIVSRGSVGSAEADFGQYYFNDHHFHYGYFINAAATLAKLYPDYYKSRAEYFKIILADFAGTCYYEELPCKPRAKDPFLGFSFSKGLFELEFSRDQESTAESCNAYWAVRELGKNLNDKSLENLGNFLLSTEILATKTYWQIKKDSKIYSTPFSSNGIVGTIYETKAEYKSNLEDGVEFIFGKKMIPFNHITREYLDREWLTETREKWSSAMESEKINEEWKGIFLLTDSILNPNSEKIGEQIRNLKSYDLGNSKTNTLFFYFINGGQGISNEGTDSPISSTSTIVIQSDMTTKVTQTATTNKDDLTTNLSNEVESTTVTSISSSKPLENDTTVLFETSSIFSNEKSTTIKNEVTQVTGFEDNITNQTINEISTSDSTLFDQDKKTTTQAQETNTTLNISQDTTIIKNESSTNPIEINENTSNEKTTILNNNQTTSIIDLIDLDTTIEISSTNQEITELFIESSTSVKNDESTVNQESHATVDGESTILPAEEIYSTLINEETSNFVTFDENTFFSDEHSNTNEIQITPDLNQDDTTFENEYSSNEPEKQTTIDDENKTTEQNNISFSEQSTNTDQDALTSANSRTSVNVESTFNSDKTTFNQSQYSTIFQQEIYECDEEKCPETVKESTKCSNGDLACINLLNSEQCFNPSQFSCFNKGYLCEKPKFACFNVNIIYDEKYACYDQKKYKCVNGELVENSILN